MLVLSRKTDERIQIGKDIFVTVLGIKGGRVRLGFEAPRNVRICRNDIRSSRSTDVEEVSAEYTCCEPV